MRRILPLAVIVSLAACTDLGPTTPGATDAANQHQLAPPGVEARSITVLSRNLYYGADLDAIFVPGADIGELAEEAWATIQFTNFPARAQALANEILMLQPHLVGLQEVTTYTILSTGFQVLGQLDFLAQLLQATAALGLDYRLAIRVPSTTFTAPVGSVANPDFYVHYQDSDAILYRGDVEIVPGSPRGGLYAARVPLPVGIDLTHTWQWVDAVVANQTVRFANTHLETQGFAAVQEAQTAELLQRLAGSPLPVILVGDFNSAANPSAPADRKTGTYGMLLGAGYVDLWTHEGPRDRGLTCCHASDLTNAVASFDQRLDLVLARNVEQGGGFAGGTALVVTGEEAGDRFTLGPGYSLWPSDHAGIAASVWLPKGFGN